MFVQRQDSNVHWQYGDDTLSEELACTPEELSEWQQREYQAGLEERIKQLEKRVTALENLNKKPDTEYNPSWIDKLKKEKAKI